MYATLFVAGLLLTAKTQRDAEDSHTKSSLRRLGDATALVATQINGDHITKLLEKYPKEGLLIKHTQDAWYFVMHDQLKRTTELLELNEPLLIVAWDGSGPEMQIVATAEQQPRFRESFHGDAAAYSEAIRNNSRSIRSATDGTHSIFEVLNDGAGRPIGLVIGSLDMKAIGAEPRAQLWQRIGMFALVFGLAALLLFGSVGRWLRRDEALHNALRKRHDHVADSIAYAAKIQRALVPRPEVYNKLFQASFVIDKPKDVVSGDFHWYHQVDEHTCYVAAADCTGHGLPGAMMAAIGCSLLNEVVPRNQHLDPAELLAMLNARTVTTLHQQGQTRGAGDGMDLALCRIDTAQREILFAGAHRPLYWLHAGRLSVINGDRRGIGGAHQEVERRYTTHRLAYLPGDRIYLFSDGYVDQFGGPEKKRFMSTRLQRILQENQHLNMHDQATLLEHEFLAWQGDEEQVDDVSMLALAV